MLVLDGIGALVVNEPGLKIETWGTRISPDTYTFTRSET